MEDRRLDYYQPLLSVRRSPSPAPLEKNRSEKDDHALPKIPTLPSYKPELKSGPIRNAGTVPFVWEQCPGKPKDESKSRICADQSPVIAPKLPPGRIKEMRKQTSEYSSASKQNKEVPYGLHSVSVSNENETTVESTKDVLEIENSDTKEGDEEYLDALDTSPRTESFFLNSSFSGISELDGLSVKTYGNFSIDPETRDFMMDRFLPAAKAMTSEAPQHSPRKQPVVQEQLTQMVKVESSDKSPPLRYRPNVVPHYAYEEGEEESGDDFDDHGQLPAKACGLLPHLCLKGSFFPSNPLPRMRRRTRLQLSRTHGRSLYAASCCINENKGIKATVYLQKPIGGSQISKHEDTIKSKNRSNQHNHFFPQKMEGSDLYRRVQGGGMLAHQNDLLQSTSAQKPLSSYDYELPRYAFSEQRGDFGNDKEAKNAGETGVNTNGKGFRTFKELLADTNSNEEVDIGSPMIEKTLHVDIIHKVESPSMHSYSPEIKGMPNLNADILEDVEKCKTVENTHSADFSYEDAENFKIKLKEDHIKVTAQRHVNDSTAAALAERSNQVSTTKLPEDSTRCRSPTKDLATTMKTEVLGNMNNDSKSLQSLNAEDVKIPKDNYSMISSPPPLPKSPSDSWLSRTLPSMASKAPSLQASFGKTIHPSNHTSNKSSANQKWETVVKSSRDHHRQEPLASIPEI